MGIFEHEAGNKHFKFPLVNADWTGLTRKTIYHERQMNGGHDMYFSWRNTRCVKHTVVLSRCMITWLQQQQRRPLQCWPLFGAMAFSLVLMGGYMIRLISQKDQIVNRSRQVCHDSDVKTRILMFNNNYRAWDKINPQLKKPHLDKYEITR